MVPFERTVIEMAFPLIEDHDVPVARALGCRWVVIASDVVVVVAVGLLLLMLMMMVVMADNDADIVCNQWQQPF